MLSSSERKRCSYERLPSDLDLKRGACAEVANPIGVLTPHRADDGLAGFGVIAQDHGDGGVWLSGRASGVDQQQEGVAQERSPSLPIQNERDPEHCEGKPTRLPAKAKDSFGGSREPIGLYA